MKKTILGIFFLLIPITSEARALHLGVAIGANYSMGSAITNLLANTTTSLSGFGLGGAVSLSLFQDNWIGLRVNEDYISTQISSGAFNLSTKALVTSALLAFNFNLFGNRHSLGLGGAWNYNMSSTVNLNGINTSATLFGLAIEGKDMWQVNKTQYVFISAKVFALPYSSVLAVTNINMVIGYDF